MLSELIEWETEQGGLTGDIPASIKNNTKLKWFSVWNNKMSGNITEEICRATSLEGLWLSRNQYSGIIPLCIGSLQKLLVFDVSENILTGHLNVEICKVKSIEQIWLASNQFSGIIPSCIGMLQNLWYFDIADNIMSGPIPESLGDIPGLEELYLNWDPNDGHENKFTGSVPASLNNLTDLTWLYLNVETLEGPLPDLSSLVNLLTCSFIPSGLCLPNDYLPPVNTADCQFDELPQCSQAVLDKDCAIVMGWVPSIFEEGQHCCEIDAISCKDGGIVSLMLSDHDIQGHFPVIPDGSLKELLVLDLSNNEISGPITGEINTFVKLQELNLAGNDLDGSIPNEMCDLLELIILNLARNNLEGPLPIEFDQLDFLEELYLSSNPLLSGPIPILSSLIVIDKTGTNLSIQETVTSDTSASSPMNSEDASQPLGGSSSSFSATIAGVIGACVFLVIALAFVAGIYLYLRRAKQRREDTSYTQSDDWSEATRIPMNSMDGSGMYFTDEERPNDANGLGFKCLISTGGFGQVWKVYSVLISREPTRDRQSQ
jgi:Leucine-rich repeat (LRR) protein